MGITPDRRQTLTMALPELRSPVARALLPVVGGIVVLSAIAGFLWLMAAYISSGSVDS